MEKKKFKKLLGNNLDEYGFKYIKKSYYRETEEVMIVIATQKSSFGDDYYINYGFLIKGENPEVQYPKDYECDTRGRFIFQKDGKQSDNFIPDSLCEREFSNIVKENLEKVIKPVFDFGLAKYFEIYPELVVVANLKARKYLKL